MWTFTPKLNRVIRLPFSMMSQGWAGSDFSYSDLSRTDQLLHEYELTLVATEQRDGHQVYTVDAVPHDDAPVVWGKEQIVLRDDYVLLGETFFDQAMQPLKRLEATRNQNARRTHVRHAAADDAARRAGALDRDRLRRGEVRHTDRRRHVHGVRAAIRTQRMNAATSSHEAHRDGRPRSDSIVAISWRNLWRNRARTWLAAGGIAFAVMLILAARSAQVSGMSAMLDNSTRMLTGHLQVQNAAYAADPALRNLIPDATAVARALANVPEVTAVAQRAATFALVSVGDRSYGAQVMGVDPAAERAISSLPDMLVEGRYLDGASDAVVGSVMARNLGAKVGDELVILGSALDGGVAAMSLRIVGVLDTGTPDLDRALIQVQLAAMQDAFGLGDQVHIIVARLRDFMRAQSVEPKAVGGRRGATSGPRRAVVATSAARTRAIRRAEAHFELDVVRADRAARDVQHLQQLFDDGVRAHAGVRHAARDRHAAERHHRRACAGSDVARIARRRPSVSCSAGR